MREMQRETDWLDAARQVTEVETEHRIAERERPPEPLSADVALSSDDLRCPACGEPIPEARVRAGYTICVVCQDARERNAWLHRGG